MLTEAMPTPNHRQQIPWTTLLSHLASLYPHSTPQAWQQKLNNGEVTLNGVTATGSESVASGQTLSGTVRPGSNQTPLALRSPVE